MLYTASFNGIPVRFAKGPDQATAPFLVVDDLVAAIGSCLKRVPEARRRRMIEGPISKLVDGRDRDRVALEEDGHTTIKATVSSYQVVAMMQAFAILERNLRPQFQIIAKDVDAFRAWFAHELGQAQDALGYSFEGFWEGCAALV